MNYPILGTRYDSVEAEVQNKCENGYCTKYQIGVHMIKFIILTQPLALGHIVATVNPGP